MESDSGGSNFELPVPETPEQPAERAQEKEVERQRPATQEAGVGKRAPQPGAAALPDVTQLPQAPTAVPSEPTDQPASAGSVSPTTRDLKAADGDLIEKEWIHRAKAIVDKTKDDPHQQKSEMSKVKADYIQKRFNKAVKTDEATA